MSAFLQSVYEFDLSVFAAVFKIGGNEILDTIMKVITTLGDGWIMPVFAAILLVFKKTRKAGMAMLGALLVMVILNNEILKPMIARIRPCFMFSEDNLMSMKAVFEEEGKIDRFNDILPRVQANIKNMPQFAALWNEKYVFPNVVSMPTSWSFPSGHTSSSFAFATAVFANNKKYGIAAYVLAAVIGFSRIYLGVHYCTDVLAGAVLGIIYGIIGVLVVSFIIKLIKKKDNKLSKLF